jgi:hypothetical protein
MKIKEIRYEACTALLSGVRQKEAADPAAP